MYRDPDEVTAEENIAKVERAAATRRSTIRRESTIRPRRYVPPITATRELAELIPGRSQPHRSPFVDANDEIQHLEAELERLRRHRILTHTRRGASRGLATLAPEDVTVYARHPSSELASHLPRESALRFELGPGGPSRSGATSPRRHRISRDSWVNRRTLPSPPDSIESSGRVRVPEGVQTVVPDGPVDTDLGHTRDFAPARGPYRGTPQPSEGMTRLIIERNSENIEGSPPVLETPADTPHPETWDGSYPPLRRVGHLSPRPRASYDVLGDRRRSMSPHSPTSAESIVNEDHWETLLTTIDDDDDLRSNNQPSFDSVRSNSEPDSNRSTQTAATSFGEIGSADDTCDLDLPHGITESHVREIRERHRGTRSQEYPTLGEDHQRSERRSTGLGSSTGMAMFQNLLTRMTRREDIPDEWWQSAGLARIVRENA